MLRHLCVLAIARGNKENILTSGPLCSHIILVLRSFSQWNLLHDAVESEATSNIKQHSAGDHALNYHLKNSNINNPGKNSKLPSLLFT